MPSLPWHNLRLTITYVAVTVQGNSVAVGSGSSAYAAIDTGTTLIGGPASEIAAIFAQIPGSAVASGDYEGYYTYPCSTTVDVSFSFGSKTWSISPADFQLTPIGNGQCLGAFFELTSSSPSWIIGDTFLVSDTTVVFQDLPIDSSTRKTFTLFSDTLHLQLDLPRFLILPSL